jgi:RNA polymerase sigma-70 factor (ECF subfamily)
MDDQDLIRRAARGEIEAFETLVERRRDRVFWIAYHVVGDTELARDVTQEVFLRLFRVIGRYRSGGRFDAWLYRITMNLGIDALRRERPHRETAPLQETSVVGGADPGHLGKARRPQAEALGGEEVRRIFAELSGLLPKKQRFAFILREIEGLSTAEVAAILRTTESTVRNQVLQARRVLQGELRRRYPEYCPPP